MNELYLSSLFANLIEVRTIIDTYVQLDYADIYAINISLMD